MESRPKRLIDNSAVTVGDLVRRCPDLTWIAGQELENKPLGRRDDRQATIGLVGYFNPIHPTPIQVIGHREWAYLNKPPREANQTLPDALTGAVDNSVLIVADGLAPTQQLVSIASQKGVALLSCKTAALPLIAQLQDLLSDLFTPQTLMHGVMMAVYGLGVLITGSSGIGKSELGLELLSRNHRLVADDAVEIRRTPKDGLIASCPENLQGHLEVRGLGILNIRDMFGYAAVLKERRLDLVVQLQRIQPSKETKLDRLQIMREQQIILGLERPRVSLIIAPGRNLAVLVEAAVRDCILRMRGRNASAEFVHRHMQSLIGDAPTGNAPES